VQIHWKLKITSEQYVKTQAWLNASISRCPIGKKCEGKAPIKNGTYTRKFPNGIKIARLYCQPCGVTFSLLPDCLASCYSATLVELEKTIKIIHECSTFDEAVSELRPDIEQQGGRRWLRRRVQRIQLTLLLVSTLLATAPTKMVEIDLAELREKAAGAIYEIPTPVGFCHRPLSHWNSAPKHPHTMGPDPPE
jgi:hypothetical protein